jgi:outer membrane receptor protein involved in Fe transport
LYGEGSLAGTVRYLTRNPSLTKTSGFVEANLYRQGEGGMGRRLSGAFGTPLVDGKVGLRIAAGSDKLAGWIDYPQLGAKDANEGKRYFIRPKLLPLRGRQRQLRQRNQAHGPAARNPVPGQRQQRPGQRGRSIRLRPGHADLVDRLPQARPAVHPVAQWRRDTRQLRQQLQAVEPGIAA